MKGPVNEKLSANPKSKFSKFLPFISYFRSIFLFLRNDVKKISRNSAHIFYQFIYLNKYILRLNVPTVKSAWYKSNTCTEIIYFEFQNQLQKCT